MEQQQQKNLKQRMDENLNLLIFFGEVCSRWTMVFVRKNFGPEAMHLEGLVAAVVLFFIAGLSASVAMWQFFFVWLAMTAFQRIRTTVLVWRGWKPHSRYVGEPALARLFTRNRQTGYWLEPFLVTVIGGLLTGWSSDVGTLVMFSGFCLLGSHMTYEQRIKIELRRMHDARIEQAQLMDRFQGGGGRDPRR